MRRGTREVMVSVHAGDPRGTQDYFGWYLHAVRPDRFLSREEDLLDKRWNIPPPDIPAAAAHERDDLVMPGDEAAPRRRAAPEPRPRQAAPARGKLTRRDQRRRARMLVAGAAAHVDEERAEEQQEYDRQEETGMTSMAEFQPHSQEQTGLDELFHMNASPTDEFTSIAESFRMSRAQHFDQGASSSHPPAPPPPASHDTPHHVPWVPTYSSPPVIGYPVFDPTRIGSEYATPPSYHAPSSYHSQSYDAHSAPLPTMPHDRSVERGRQPAADPPPPSPSRGPRREIRPHRCGTGGHIQPQDGR
ncbi:hypothetical protein PIB30_031707 [Stylosanthes scabra]|uniref:Uncharacterized protein n=1 Tax=Stylosanthes scabra TaxID=79078 RepID=A0ABU6RC52_9FABA|nr:hypothetical protein [Stylosanthes scabra]